VIKRHTKIKAEANPYDLAFEEYFEQRLERGWRESMQGQRKVLMLWLRQQNAV
jgi:RNA-directed DNA polymerase